MAAPKRYWVWIDGMNGEPPHKLLDVIESCGITGAMLGHSFGSWSAASAYLRKCMRTGFVCRIYETEDN